MKNESMRKSLLTTITIIISLAVIWSPGKSFSFAVNLIFSVISVISSYFIFSDSERHFTLFKTFNIFSLFFMGIAPAAQFKANAELWGERLYEHDYIVAGLLYLFAFLVFAIIYSIEKKKGKGVSFLDHLFNNHIDRQNIGRSSIFLMIFVSLALFVYIFYCEGFNVLNMFFRGTIDDITAAAGVTETKTSNMVGLLNENFIRPVNSLLAICFYLLFGHQHKSASALLFFLAFITMAPTAVARFAAAAIYLPILLTLFPFLRKKNYYAITLVFGLLVVWPFLSIFRYFDVNESFSFSLGIKEMFESGNMDSFSSLARVMKYDIVTYGRQLLGVLLFWVPRFLWVHKPIGSGAFLAQTINLDFENLACNYFAEGYINFGLVGVVAYSIVLAIVLARIDNMFWNSTQFGKSNSAFFTCFYYMSLGLLFFILRGDGLSSFAYTVGFSVALCVSRFILRLKI